MSKNLNHYQTLNISQKASQKEIKQAYRRLVKQFHPDSQSETASHEEIVRINIAYEILADPRSRHNYDQQLAIGDAHYSSRSRQQRTTNAQVQHQRQRQAQKQGEVELKQWYQQVYLPLDQLLSQIVNPLEREIDFLSGDPFDDELITSFREYLQRCSLYLHQAKQLFASQANPPQLAKLAANIYYCLNQIGDGIEELEFFTLNYDYNHIHTGRELFRIVEQLRAEARGVAVHFVKTI